MANLLSGSQSFDLLYISRHSFFRCSAFVWSNKSRKTYGLRERSPMSLIAFTAVSIIQYWSLKQVVPVFIISRQASFVPQYISSSSRRGSIFQIISSHSCRWESSFTPRISVIALCVCIFTNPGIAAFLLPSITVAPSASIESAIFEIILSYHKTNKKKG